MNVQAFVARYRTQLLAGAGVGVAALAVARRKSAGTSAVRGTAPAQSPTYDSTSQDLVGWIQPQLDALARQQSTFDNKLAALTTPKPAPAPKPKPKPRPKPPVGAGRLNPAQARLKQRLDAMAPPQKQAFNAWVAATSAKKK